MNVPAKGNFDLFDDQCSDYLSSYRYEFSQILSHCRLEIFAEHIFLRSASQVLIHIILHYSNKRQTNAYFKTQLIYLLLKKRSEICVDTAEGS